MSSPWAFKAELEEADERCTFREGNDQYCWKWRQLHTASQSRADLGVWEGLAEVKRSRDDIAVIR